MNNYERQFCFCKYNSFVGIRTEGLLPTRGGDGIGKIRRWKVREWVEKLAKFVAISICTCFFLLFTNRQY